MWHRKLGEWNQKLRQNSACERNRELVLKLGRSGESLNEIARRIKTNSRHVRDFLDRNGVVREYKANYGGDRSPSWKGGKHISKEGYVYIASKNHPHKNHAGYVLEHRLIMERLIGRYLLPNEVVHHRDGNPSNNSPKNLQLFSENSDHLRHELKGRRPNWSSSGILKVKEAIAKAANLKRGNTRPPLSALDVKLSLETPTRLQVELGKGPPCL